MNNIFEKASKLKLRFTTGRGECSTEELWDLDLKDLDTIAKAINKKIKEGTEESFIEKKNSTDTILELKLEILKSIIQVRLKEKDDAKTRSEKKAQLEVYEQLLLEKKTEELKGLSTKEITKKLDALKAELV